MDKVVTSEKVLVGGDFNGHAHSDMGGFGGVGIGQINDGGGPHCCIGQFVKGYA